MSTNLQPSHIEILSTHCIHDSTISRGMLDQIVRESSRITPKLSQNIGSLQINHEVSPAVSGFIANSDTNTLLHSTRVALMSRMAATMLGYEKWDVDRAELSGFTHDLGKQIPQVASIISSGQPLTPAERQVVNKHARFGFELLYRAGDETARPVRQRLGEFMGQVALDVLFSHANAVAEGQSGIDEIYLGYLIETGVITEADATSHPAKSFVQLVAVADVTDALLSCGDERNYRTHRLIAEGRSPEIDPVKLPELIQNIIDVPAIDVKKIVPIFAAHYKEISRQADSYAGKLIATVN